MEFSLHRELKHVYAADDALVEVRLGAYRIDVVIGEELVEIQHGSLAAIRDKIAALLVAHRVVVVKPLVVKKTLVSLSRKGGKPVGQRLSPKRGTLLDLFDELVYFTRVFPHPNLTIETPLVEVEERRYPGHGKRRRWRAKDYLVDDLRLVAVTGVHRFANCSDLWRLLPKSLAKPFHTGELASALGVRRGIAQRIAYCLRKTGAASVAGKRGNAWLYERAA